ncbi:MAG: putative endonuclease [Candidatus Berkelbacteria bacterium Athens1014_28]|uniref:Putative endonuclease n=1 Tax=Candidatus Berkelbacteria bacterium Athens1014_28 TaxID=2017145 RepID=A0A554LJ98_9BACT|nr:MAG: putative endonuclease [Candidatus Berkelbacteria bacterium Athens1014_28]
MKPFTVYILYLKKTGKLYTGFTSDLKQRLKDHISDKVKSTAKRKPILIHYENYLLKSDAMRREKFLKTTEGKRLLKMQIRDILVKLKI